MFYNFVYCILEALSKCTHTHTIICTYVCMRVCIHIYINVTEDRNNWNHAFVIFCYNLFFKYKQKKELLLIALTELIYMTYHFIFLSSMRLLLLFFVCLLFFLCFFYFESTSWHRHKKERR